MGCRVNNTGGCAVTDDEQSDVLGQPAQGDRTDLASILFNKDPVVHAFEPDHDFRQAAIQALFVKSEGFRPVAIQQLCSKARFFCQG